MHLRAAVAAVTAVTALLPMAAAQVTYDLSLDAPDPLGPLAVDVEEANMSIPWRISCMPQASPGAPATDPAQLHWDVPAAQAPGIIVRGETSVQIEAPDCATTMETQGTHVFTVAATQEAPGLTPIAVALNATLQWGSATAWETNANTHGQVTVAYLGLLTADAPIRIQEMGPGQTSNWTTRITNLGNAPSLVLVEADVPQVEAPGIWPEEPLAAGETDVLEVLYHHPDGAGWNNDQATFRLTLTPVSAQDDTLEGTPVVTNSLARTRGLPGVGLPVVAMAIGVLLMRRR